jgi:hypothetical protein
MRLRHATIFLLPLFIAACLLTSCRDLKFWESETAPPAKKDPFNAAQLLDVRKRAATIQTELDRLPRQDFSFTIGDTMITAVLYGDSGNPLQVDERWADRNGNSGRNRFYFDKGTLFHIYARSSINLNPMGDASDRAETLYRLYFNDNGNMFHYEKLMGESRIDLGDDEMPAFMRRAEALRQLVPVDSAGAFDTSAVVAILHSSEGSNSNLEAAGVDDALPNSDMPSTNDGSLTKAEQTPQAVQETPKAEASKKPQPPKAVENNAQAPAVQKSKQPSQAVSSTKKPHTAIVEKAAPAKPAAVTRQSQPPSSTKGVATPKQAASQPQGSQKAGLVRKPIPPLPDEDADAVIPAHTHRMIPGPLNSSRVRFQKGSTGITLSASLEKGRHNEYVLRARRGQTMQVTLDTEQPDAAFRVFLDNSDISGERRSWTGTLPRYADYHVVVYLKQQAAAQTAGYTITIGIP